MNKKYLLISIVFFSIAFLSMFFVLGKMVGNRYLPIIERLDFEKEAELSEIILPDDELSFYFTVNGYGPHDYNDSTEYLYKAVIKDGELKAYEASIDINEESGEMTYTFPTEFGGESVVIDYTNQHMPDLINIKSKSNSLYRSWYVSSEKSGVLSNTNGSEMYLTNNLLNFNSLHVKDSNGSDIKLTRGGINTYNRFSMYYGGTLPEQILHSGFLNDHLVYIQFQNHIGEHYKYKDCILCKRFEDPDEKFDLKNYISRYVNIDKKDKLHWDGSIIIMDINTGKWNDSLIGSYIDIPSEYITKDE